MISDLKNELGFVFAYIAWRRVDSLGHAWKNGKYIRVEQCWIHPYFRNKGTLSSLITLIDKHKDSQGVEYVYWTHRKRNIKFMVKRSIAAKRGLGNELLKKIISMQESQGCMRQESVRV